MQDYQAYVGLEQKSVNNRMEQHLEELERDGYFILEGVFKEPALEVMRQKLDAVWELQLAEYGEELLEQIGDYGQLRCMMEYDPFFFELINHPTIWPYVAATVGDTAILHLQNGIVLFSDRPHNQARYHKDFAKNFTSSKILSFNAFIAVDDFTEITGGTWVLPGSHRFSEMPSPAYFEKHGVQIKTPAGSVIFFDSMIWHKGGVNTSGKRRRAINQIYTRPFIKQQIDYPAMYKGKIDMETKLAQTLGLWTIPPKNLGEYRVDHPSKRTYRGGQG